MPTGDTHVLTLAPGEEIVAASRGLAEALQSADARRGGDLASAGYLRIEQPLRTADVLGWLRAQAPLARFYWAERGGGFALAGAGIAEEVEDDEFGALTALVGRFATGDAAASARVFATARFDVDAPIAREWMAFNRVYVQVPLLELRREGDAFLLAVNLKAGDALRSGGFDAQRRTAVKALGRCAEAAARGPSRYEASPDEDDRAAWRTHVGQLLAEVRRGALGKAVLARRRHLEADAPIDPLALLATLEWTQQDAYRFLVQPTPEVAFLGASPERLYRRRGRALSTEALAGTRPRGATSDEDERLARELLASEKDAREHEWVRSHVVERLAPLSGEVSCAAAPAVRALPHLQHLHTPIEATLRGDVDDATLLAALHPTPAVCGMPTDAARAFLRATEGFDRGLYAGPVGCFGRDAAECAVAIRSALVQGREVQLFAGAGIVEGSDADSEWQETVQKMKPFEASLGGGDVA